CASDVYGRGMDFW
nr:immunoglobulin heavy chain junction region [Macaca mulatta]